LLTSFIRLVSRGRHSCQNWFNYVNSYRQCGWNK